MPQLTPTEQRIVDLLADGMPHVRDELMRVLNDDMTSVKTLAVHLYSLRRKLRPVGQDIVTEVTGGRRPLAFRHVRLLASAYSGYR